jgi:lactate permease
VLFTLASFGPLQAFLDAHSGWKLAWPGLQVLGSGGKPASATTFNLNIRNAGGTVLLVSGLITAAIYRLSPRRLVRAFVDVVVQFRWTILGLFRKVVGWSLGLLGMALLVFLQSTPVLGWMVVAP